MSLMERVSRALEAEPGGLSGNALYAVVKGNKALVVKATRYLLDEGFAVMTVVKQTNMHTSSKPFRASGSRTPNSHLVTVPLSPPLGGGDSGDSNPTIPGDSLGTVGDGWDENEMGGTF